MRWIHCRNIERLIADECIHCKNDWCFNRKCRKVDKLQCVFSSSFVHLKVLRIKSHDTQSKVLAVFGRIDSILHKICCNKWSIIIKSGNDQK